MCLIERCEGQSLADESESEEDDGNDSDFDEQPLAKRKKAAPKKPAGQSGTKRPAPKGKKVICIVCAPNALSVYQHLSAC